MKTMIISLGVLWMLIGCSNATTYSEVKTEGECLQPISVRFDMVLKPSRACELEWAE